MEKTFKHEILEPFLHFFFYAVGFWGFMSIAGYGRRMYEVSLCLCLC